MAHHRDALTFIRACNWVELTATYITFDALKSTSNYIYTSRVSNEEDFIRKLLGFKVKMKDWAISIYN